MPFTAKSGKFNASINTVEFGTGDKAVKIGGENVFPLYSFDAAIENAPKVGIEITDFRYEHEPECIKKYYEGCATLADMAMKSSFYGRCRLFKFPYGRRRSKRSKQIYRRTDR